MFSQKMKHALLGTATAAAMFVGFAGSASATPVTAQTMVGGLGEKRWSDNSAETLSGPDTIVNVGDVLTGILQMSTVENTNGIPPGTRPIGASGVNELTALYSFTVTAKTCTGVVCQFVFGPTAGFGAQLVAMGFAGANANSVAGFWEDTTPDFARIGGTVVGDTATATDGANYLVLGMSGTGTFFSAVSTSGDDISLFPKGTNGGIFNGALNVDQNLTGMTFGKEACAAGAADFCLNGTVAGPDTGSPFALFDDVNFLFTVTQVPEPATLSLFGFGLLGLGAYRRRKTSK